MGQFERFLVVGTTLAHSEKKTMLRITKTFDDDHTVILRLDGKVIDTTLSDLEDLCLRYRDKEDKTVLLDFAGVTFISDSGLRMLERIKNGGIKLANGSLFVEALLTGLKD